MDPRSDVSTCANPECSSKFVRFGEGELFVFPISDPKAWELPDKAKQKVLWLCKQCSARMTVRLDRRQHLVELVYRSTFIQRAG
jgi:hypothetical protein